MNTKIRLMLVDDHTLFREGLARLLEAESGLQLIGHFSSAAEALAASDLSSVDVVLLDFDLGETQGSHFLREAREMGFEGKILMVTAGMSDADAVQILQSGASGIFLKHNAPTSLITAIRRVAAGEPWLDSTSLDSLVGAASSKSKPQASSALSKREHEVPQRRLRGPDQQGDRRQPRYLRELCQSRAAATLRQDRRPHPESASSGRP